MEDEEDEEKEEGNFILTIIDFGAAVCFDDPNLFGISFAFCRDLLAHLKENNEEIMRRCKQLSEILDDVKQDADVKELALQSLVECVSKYYKRASLVFFFFASPLFEWYSAIVCHQR